MQRTISKINYPIHTDAIKESLIPYEITKQQVSFVYANEADFLHLYVSGLGNGVYVLTILADEQSYPTIISII